MTPRVLVVVVNYHGDAETRVLVSDLRAQTCGVPIDVVVVDNSGGFEGSSLEVSDVKGHVRIRKPVENLGYFGAVRWALDEYQRDSGPPSWLVISNSDIRIEDPRFFERLTAVHGSENVGAVAPDIFSPRFGHQNPSMGDRPSSLRMHFYKWVFKTLVTALLFEILVLTKRALFRFFRRRPKLRLEDAPARDVYCPHGSFMVISGRYFERGGTLNNKVFLFGEDVFLGEKQKELGLRIVYDPGLQVLHYGHGTVGLKRVMRLWKYQAEAAAYCADTFFGRSGGRRA